MTIPNSPVISRQNSEVRQYSTSIASIATLPFTLGSQGHSNLHSPVDDELESPTESTFLASHSLPTRSYGTLPLAQRRFSTKQTKRGPPSPLKAFKRNVTLDDVSEATTPRILRTRLSELSFRYSMRPKTMYDEPLRPVDGAEISDADAKVNGIRVWYTSYTSIDWLHDAIKDSLRFATLRRRKSFRSRLRLMFDKSLGWIIVTIVGFLSAIVAFLVVRSEQWLFDLKEGYCTTSVWRAKSFCCPRPLSNDYTKGIDSKPFVELCSAWKPWNNVLFPDDLHHENGAVEYISYTFIAVLLASIACILTIYLTKSTTFISRKESVVGTPSPAGISKGNQSAEPKRQIMYYAAGSGIPEIKTILSGFVIHGYLGARTLFTKAVGLAFAVASGLSLGKEGPFVHIASCVGNTVSRIATKYENNEAKRREILSAAGVAVAFGAPIGGTLFSLEEVSYFFPPKVMWRSFFCAMIAAITLKMLDPFGTGKLVLFQVTYDRDWHAWELVPFLIISICCGVYGAYFSKLNYRWCKNVRNKTFLDSHPLTEVILITLLTSMLCFLNPYTRMGGTELVYNLFAECRTGSGDNHSGLCIVDPGSYEKVWPVVRSILVAMIVKGGLTIITFGIKVPCGIFIPTLGVGACVGRVVGIAMQWIQMNYPSLQLFKSCEGNADCIVPGLYAMVGAAAALSGVTRTTVSLAVIMFELTDTLTYAVPVMLSVLVAKTVADALEPKGIYDLVIELNQLPYLDSKHEYLWGNLQINDVTQRDVAVIRVDEKNTASSLTTLLLSLTATGNDDSGFPIIRNDVDGDLRMVGYIGSNELDHALSLVPDVDQDVHFHATYAHHWASSGSISSLPETGRLVPSDPFDFTPYMDQAPLTMSNNSPMELVHQVFVKLGARYIIITDTEGLYEGIIDKKTWLAFLSDLEEK